MLPISNELFGAYYFDTNKPATYEADSAQLYYFKTFIGKHKIQLEKGD